MRSNRKHSVPDAKPQAEVSPNALEGLSEAGSARRDFLGHLGKWGATLAIFGLGAESAMRVLLNRSALSSAKAAGAVYGDIPSPPEPTGTVYWVATHGSDSNTGTETEPFATVQKAHDICSKGDGIYVKAGTYVSGRIDWKKSGVILRGAPGTTREQVILQRNGPGSGSVIWVVSNRINGGDAAIEDCQIYGLTVQGGEELTDPYNQVRTDYWRQDGLRFQGYVRNFKIINCVTRYLAYRGILISNGSGFDSSDFCHNFEIAYCHFYKQNAKQDGGTSGVGGGVALGSRCGYVYVHHNNINADVDGVLMEDAFIGSLIEHNTIHEGFGPWPLDKEPGRFRNSEDGVDLKKVYRDNPFLPEDSRTIIRNNTIYGFPRQTGVTVQMGCQRVDVYDNHIYECGHGVWLRTWSGGTTTYQNCEGRNCPNDYTKDVKIWNNDIHNCDYRGFTMIHYGVQDLQFFDNKVYDCGNVDRHAAFRGGNRYAGFYIDSGMNIQLSGNVISNNGQLSAGNPQIDIQESRLSELTSNSNIFYFPDSSLSLARVGSNFYDFPQWQESFGQDIDSTLRATPYRAPTPPQSPGSIEVSGAGNFEDAVKRATNLIREDTSGSLG